jgi:lipopolysaccharide export LptBFGC system permease protein LptF
MTIIDRYIAKNFLGGYFILLVAGIGLLITFDALANFDEFIEDKSASFLDVLATMADFYGYNLPMYASQLGAPLMGVAAAFTLGNMLRNNEMTALIAAGMPLQRLAAPILICTILVIALWAINKEFVIPEFAPKIARSHDDISGKRTEGVNFVRDPEQALLTAQRLDPRSGRLERLQIIVPNENGQYDRLIDADAATYDPQADTWRLERGRFVERAAAEFDEPFRWQPVDEYAYGLTPEQLVLFQKSEWTELLSIRQMNALIATGRLPNLPVIVVSRHVRLTEPLIFFVLVMLTVPFFLNREPGNVLTGGAKAMAVSGAFLAVAFVAHNIISEQGAVIRAWAPILCFGPLAVLQLANVRT